jgi:hypothetical protein
MTENIETVPERIDLVDDADRDASIPAEEFVEALHAVREADHRLAEIQSDLASIRTGLREEDAIRLIYGRNSDCSLEEIRALFDTLDAIAGSDTRKLTIRLLADLGGCRIDDAEDFIEEVERLRERYGDLATQNGGRTD